MEELELTYLIKYVPEGLKNSPFREIIDIYIPSSVEHPDLRIRKSGDVHEITKKQPIDKADKSHQIETTIPLTPKEYEEFNTLQGKRVRKIRYYYKEEERAFEIDIFQDNLAGLILVDAEFTSLEEKNSFEMPKFCLVEVTQEKFAAGGMLAGKNYVDIEQELNKFGYAIPEI